MRCGVRQVWINQWLSAAVTESHLPSAGRLPDLDGGFWLGTSKMRALRQAGPGLQMRLEVNLGLTPHLAKGSSR